MVSDTPTDDDPVLEIADLDWMSRELLVNLDDADGTANTRELKQVIGIENTGSINHRLEDYLTPGQLVEEFHPEKRGVTTPPKVLSLTSQGEEVAEMIKQVEAGEDEEGQLPLDQRLDRLESGLEARYGSLDLDAQRELRTTVELMRVMRDFLLEKHGDEFRSYIEENFG